MYMYIRTYVYTCTYMYVYAHTVHACTHVLNIEHVSKRAVVYCSIIYVYIHVWMITYCIRTCIYMYCTVQKVCFS